MLSVLLLPEGFARILDTITPSWKCWLIWKNHQWALPQAAHSLCYCHSPKKSCWELMTTWLYFKLEDHLVGGFTKSGSFSPTHIPGHPHISHQICESYRQKYRVSTGNQKKMTQCLYMLKSLAAFGKTGRVWSWRGQI